MTNFDYPTPPMPFGAPNPFSVATGDTLIGSVVAFAGELRIKDKDSGEFKTNPLLLGWLLCDGRSVNVAEYPELFAALGYRYGGNNDAFNIPDYQGQFLRGVSGSAASTENRTPAKHGGRNEVGSTQLHAVQAHSHEYIKVQLGTTAIGDPPSTTAAQPPQVAKTNGTFINSGTSKQISDRETRPDNTFVYWLIKARS